MTRRFGLGLRAQILIALSVAFLASFPLLGVAAVQLTERARAADRVLAARATVRVLAGAIEAGGPEERRERFDRLARSALGQGGIAGAELLRGELEPWTAGVTSAGTPVEAPLDGGGAVRLWVRAPEEGTTAPLANLLLLYVAVTAGAILLLAYLALTYLIVRPVESVTRASERLAEGRSVEVPVRGAAEVARLAVAFNQMAAELRRDREALESRLEELERTTLELRSAQDQVVRSGRLAAVGRLAAGVAHEIGNPLSAILGLIELLQGGDLEEAEAREFLRRIQAETERIHKIIRGLLDFARQGDADDDETADLGRVVEDAVRLVAPQKDLREIMIERRIAGDLPHVRGSADRLEQVVLNLLLNAADAIGRDGSIVIEVAPDGDCVSIAISDSGPGIAPEVLGSLFEPFVTTKPTGRGTGLGLAVSHTIVERLGGTIRATNPEGGGARFEVRIPVATR